MDGGAGGGGEIPFLARFLRSPLALTSLGMFQREKTVIEPNSRILLFASERSAMHLGVRCVSIPADGAMRV
jgi:hypothetical protein